MTAQTTTQRTAKHRLAVKERMARYEAALEEIVTNVVPSDGGAANWCAHTAAEALNPTRAY